MAKPKRGGNKGLTKQHGPKRKLFHCYSKTMRNTLGNLRVLSKYHNRESFNLACQARGVRAPSDAMWETFCALRTKEAQDAWFAALRK